jgi:hypothetical protein
MCGRRCGRQLGVRRLVAASGSGGEKMVRAASGTAEPRPGVRRPLTQPSRLVGETPESRGAVSRTTALPRGIRIAAYLVLSCYPFGMLPLRPNHLTFLPLCLFFLISKSRLLFHSPASSHSHAPIFTDSLFFLPVGGVPISSGNENSSATNHEECFLPSANHIRASVSRKRDAGPILSRGRKVASLHFSPHAGATYGTADVTSGAHWDMPLRDGGRSARVKTKELFIT